MPEIRLRIRCQACKDELSSIIYFPLGDGHLAVYVEPCKGCLEAEYEKGFWDANEINAKEED